jgi:outer membrane protein assembly factor BamB
MRRWGIAVAAALIAVSASGCWLQVGGNALRTGDSASESTVTAANVGLLHQVWATTVSSHTASAPMVNSGRVFVASSPLMTAFDAKTGAQIWQMDTTQGPYPLPGLSDPAIANGRVISEYSINVFGGTYSFDQTTGVCTDTVASQTFPYNAPAVSGGTVAVELGNVTSGGALTTLSYGAHTPASSTSLRRSPTRCQRAIR